MKRLKICITDIVDTRIKNVRRYEKEEDINKKKVRITNEEKEEAQEQVQDLLFIISKLKNEINTGIYNKHYYKSINGNIYCCEKCGFYDTSFVTGCVSGCVGMHRQ